jgi:hypothetical protein
MTTTDAPVERPPRQRRRRTVFVVSLVAVLILAAIGTSLALLSGSSGGDDERAIERPGTRLEKFTDPQNAYTVDIDPRWKQTKNVSRPEVESWYTNTGTTKFRDNVNIVTQQIGQMDLDQYMQLVQKQASDTVPDYDLREFRIITVSDDSETGTTAKVPPQLGVFAYDGKSGGDDFGFLFVASVENGRAVLATLTAGEDRFDRVRAQVEPYLMTLRQTA